MKVTIIGSGYVGLVTGACLAELGNSVFCLDVDEKKIALLNAGGVPIYEPGLKELIDRNRAAGRLTFSTDVAASVEHADVQFIAVGTPPDEDGSADLKYVLAAARNIGRHMTGFKVVVDKSTVPVGTGDRVSAVIARNWRARSGRPAVLGGVEPRIPEGRRGRGRLHASGPHRAGLRARRAGRHAQAIMRQLYAPFNRNHERTFYGCAFGRVHQVRRQLDAGHAHLVHERAGQSGRRGRRRHRTGAHGHRFGSAHRLQLPVRRRRLRRFVLPEGRAGADAHGQRHGKPMRVLEAVEAVNDAQKQVLATRSSSASART
jgi:UDPglucose 6-dehydrogenase